MLTQRKKFTQREFKEDPLHAMYVRTTGFYYENQRMIVGAVVVVVVLVVGVLWYTNMRSENSKKASIALGDVYSLYDGGQYKQAIDGLPERGIKGLKAIVDDYGNSEAGEDARFYLANAYYHLGQYDEAIEQFKKFSSSAEVLEVSRLSGLAAAYEAKGEFKDAASNFEKAANKNPKGVNAADNYFAAARDYAKAGDNATALTLYKKVKADYATSPLVREADRAIGGLSALPQ